MTLLEINGLVFIIYKFFECSYFMVLVFAVGIIALGSLIQLWS